MESLVFHWKRDLGAPSQPGAVSIAGLGIVNISQSHIDMAAEVGGNISFSAVDVTTKDTAPRREFLLSDAVPEP